MEHAMQARERLLALQEDMQLGRFDIQRAIQEQVFEERSCAAPRRAAKPKPQCRVRQRGPLYPIETPYIAPPGYVRRSYDDGGRPRRHTAIRAPGPDRRACGDNGAASKSAHIPAEQQHLGRQRRDVSPDAAPCTDQGLANRPLENPTCAHAAGENAGSLATRRSEDDDTAPGTAVAQRVRWHHDGDWSVIVHGPEGGGHGCTADKPARIADAAALRCGL